MKLRDYILRWQEIYDKNQSRPTTYAAHGYIFKNHILPGLGEIPLPELTVEQVGDFLKERRRFGGHRPESPEYPGLGEHSSANMVYVPGFGWIESQGPNQATYAEDMYENGNKIGIMG